MFKITKLMNVLLNLCLITIVCGLMGCRSYEISRSGEYCSITISRGISHFSFEYPSEYKIKEIDINGSSTYINIDGIKQAGEGAPASFIVHPVKPKGSDWTKSAIDYELYVHQNAIDMNLVSRSNVEVDGITGEQILYTYTDAFKMKGNIPIHVVIHSVCFSDNNRGWSISLYYNKTTEELAEQYEAEFQHMLESFKILD